jgi:hypothetical protein
VIITLKCGQRTGTRGVGDRLISKYEIGKMMDSGESGALANGFGEIW